ncbi:hypothetical protein B0H10DRAFT_1940342 [Mycena sp. CBHHK59/15]|nr:hypothetical protein B0H10DRAFT_1940342 [Mycena sp. CBHHK59/15]
MIQCLRVGVYWGLPGISTGGHLGEARQEVDGDRDQLLDDLVESNSFSASDIRPYSLPPSQRLGTGVYWAFRRNETGGGQRPASRRPCSFLIFDDVEMRQDSSTIGFEMHQSLNIENISRFPLFLRKTVTDAANDAHLPLLLPVIYANLHAEDIPSLDVILAGTFPFSSLNRIFVALEGLQKIRAIPPDALLDLWPRVWACIQLLEAARQYNPDALGDDVIRVIFFRSIEVFHCHRATAKLMDSTSGVFVLVAQAWRVILQCENIPHDDVFYELCRFLGRAVIVPANVEEFIEGAGSATDLALIIIQHIDLTLPDRIEDSRFLYGVIAFLVKTEDPDGSFRSALLACGIVRTLTGVVSASWRQCERSEGFAVRRATEPEPCPSFVLDIHRNGVSLDHTVTESWPASVFEFTKMEMFPTWKAFLDLVGERVRVLKKYEVSCESIKACDNGGSLYYCSTECQTLDWHGSGHRESCPSFRSMRRSHADPLSVRELSLIRALLHSDYLAHRSEIFCRLISHINRHPGTEFYTLFWYTEGHVEIEIHPVGEYPDKYDWGVDWAYHVRRMAQSGGRMDLHSMVVSQQDGTRARMFPMRSRNSRTPQTAVGDELIKI